MWMWMALAMAQQPAECPFGVNGHQATDAALALAADAGVGWVRMDFNWYQFEPSPGVFDWSAADRFIDSAVAQGLHVYPTIAYAPAWAVAPGCNDLSPEPSDWCHNQSPDPTAWAAFVTAAVDRYGDRVKVWGLWNEPNLEHFYRDTRDTYVRDVLIPGADAVHTACADCQTAGPDLANLREASWDADEGTCLFGECIFNGWEVSLTEILAEAGDHLDVITHHRYEGSTEELYEGLLEGQFLAGVQYMHSVRSITDAHAPGKPVWITEYGWETTPGGDHSPAYAAEQLTESFRALPEVQQGVYSGAPAWPELSKLFWYDVQDDPIVHSWGQYTWGLLDGDGQPKEAYHAYVDVIADLGGCEAFVPTPPTTTTGTTPTCGGTTPPTTCGGTTTEATASDPSATTTPTDPSDPTTPQTTSTTRPADEDLEAPGAGVATTHTTGCTVAPTPPGSLVLGWLLWPLLRRRS